MKKEEWRFIFGYEGLYMVSNLGRVKSMNYRKSGKEGIIVGNKDKRGYLHVSLFKDGIKKTYYIHRLVWDAFGNSPRNGRILQVDHISNDKTDNRIENLQLLNTRDNCSKMQLTKKEKTSKYTGVTWHKKAKKWFARIYINKKIYYLGIFTTELEASQVYLKAKENLSPNH